MNKDIIVNKKKLITIVENWKEYTERPKVSETHELTIVNYKKTKNFMNNEWFECKVKYEKTMENGLVKKVNEPYLVDALNFTEAESRIIEEITPYMTGVFEVSDIKRAHYAEMFIWGTIFMPITILWFWMQTGSK